MDPGSPRREEELPPTAPIHPSKGSGQFPFGRVLKSKVSGLVYHTDYENRPEDGLAYGYVNVKPSNALHDGAPLRILGFCNIFLLDNVAENYADF